jgi:hypothetical protein
VEDNLGFSNAPWSVVLRTVDEVVDSLAKTANILESLASCEILALQAQQLEAEVTLFGIQVRRTRAGLN